MVTNHLLTGMILQVVESPFEKYSSKWESSPILGVKIKNVLSCHHLVIY